MALSRTISVDSFQSVGAPPFRGVRAETQHSNEPNAIANVIFSQGQNKGWGSVEVAVVRKAVPAVCECSAPMLVNRCG